jgi:hypothetical protein
MKNNRRTLLVWIALMMGYQTVLAQGYGVHSSTVNELLNVNYPHGEFVYINGFSEPYYWFNCYGNEDPILLNVVKWNHATMSVELAQDQNWSGVGNYLNYALVFNSQDSSWYQQGYSGDFEHIIFLKRAWEGELQWTFSDTTFHSFKSYTLCLSNGNLATVAYKVPEYHNNLKLHYLEFSPEGDTVKHFLIPFTAFTDIREVWLGNSRNRLTELPNGDIIMCSSYKLLSNTNWENQIQANPVYHTSMVRFTPEGEVVWIKDYNALGRLGDAFDEVYNGVYHYNPENHVFYVPYNHGVRNFNDPWIVIHPYYDAGILKVDAETGDSLGFVSAGVSDYQDANEFESYSSILKLAQDGGVLLTTHFNMFDFDEDLNDLNYPTIGSVIVKYDCALNMEWRKFLYMMDGELQWKDVPDTLDTLTGIPSDGMFYTTVYNLPNGDYEIITGVPIDFYNSGMFFPDLDFYSITVNACGEMDSTGCVAVSLPGKCEWSHQYTEVSEHGSDEVLLAYPNPSTDELNFRGTKVPFSLQIFNAMGQVVWQGKVNPGEAVNPTLCSGTYYLRYTYQDQVFSQPWMVMD